MSATNDIDAFIGRNARVKARAERAIEENPNDIPVLCAVSALFDSMGDFPASLELATRAVAQAPESPDAHMQQGVTRRHMGDFQGALESFKRVIALRPLAARAHHEIAQMSDLSGDPKALQTLIDVFEQVRSEPERALLAGHAIAKVLEDGGDFQASFDWLVRAKQATKALHPYDHSGARRLHETAAEGLVTEGGGFRSDEPIFIVGLPRTGTTLVDRIISSHPSAQSAGEISNLPVLVNVVAGAASDATASPESLKAAAAFDAALFGSAYVDSTRPFTGLKPRFTDKSPMNYLHAGLILRALPNARIICLRRAPMDTCVSMFKQALPVRQYGFICDIADCARYFLLFDRFVAQCRTRLPADRFTELSYESLVDNFESEVRRLIAFCGLKWDDQCLHFHENETPVATPSGRQVRSPIYKSSVGKWRNYGEKVRPAIEVLTHAGVSP